MGSENDNIDLDADRCFIAALAGRSSVETIGGTPRGSVGYRPVANSNLSNLQVSWNKGEGRGV